MDHRAAPCLSGPSPGQPRSDGGPIHRGYNLPGLRYAVHVDGTLNDPSDVDEGWSLEVAFLWADLAQFARKTACPPEPGDTPETLRDRVRDALQALMDANQPRRPRLPRALIERIRH